MAKNEKTSKKVASIAAKALKNPMSLTIEEIKIIAASALTQAPDSPQKQKNVKKPVKLKKKIISKK